MLHIWKNIKRCPTIHFTMTANAAPEFKRYGC